MAGPHMNPFLIAANSEDEETGEAYGVALGWSGCWQITASSTVFGNHRIPAGLTMPAQSVVKGDATSASSGAASILAKVSRDRYMLELDKQYPQYQLAKHKGYGTKLHYELIAQYGIQPFYRRSFLKKQGYWPEGK